MIRILFIILVIYIVVRLIRGPKKQRRKPTFKFRFGDFEQGGFNRGGKNQKRSIEEIEEAEFEDITDTEKKNKEKSKP